MVRIGKVMVKKIKITDITSMAIIKIIDFDRME
jgi:hypothetical protein